MIEIKNLSFQYKDKVILDKLDIVIPSKKIYCLMGKNGLGKTTFLNLLVGIINSNNNIIISNQIVNWQNQEYKEYISYIPENPTSPHFFKVYEFILYGLALKNKTDKNSIEKIREYLSLFGILDKEKEYCNNLSKGTLQKVVLISNLLTKPQWLIMDEPFSGVDVVSQKIIKNLLNEFVNNGSSVLFTSHLPHMVMYMADEVLMFENQKIQFTKKPNSFEEMLLMFEGKGQTNENDK